MTEIPEHLLRRAQAARANSSRIEAPIDAFAGLTDEYAIPRDRKDFLARDAAGYILRLQPRANSNTLDQADDAVRKDVTGTAAIIDVESPEVCSLASAKIRHTAVKALGSEGSIDKKYREVVINEDGTVQLKSTEKERLAFVFGPVIPDKSVSFAVWTDYVRPSLLKRTMPQDDIDKQSLVFGTVSRSLETGQRLYIPILTSIKTSNGCRFVLPAMQEQTDANYNLPHILRQLDTCVAGSDESKVLLLTEATASAVKAQDPSVSSIAFDNLREIVDAIVATNDTEQAVLRKSIAQLRAKNPTTKKIRTKDNEWHDLDVLHTRGGVQATVGNNTLSLVFTVVADGVYQYENGTFCSRWAIWSGTDEAVYGKDVAFQVPRYVIESDEYMRVSIKRYCDDLTTLQDITSLEEKDFILQEVISSKQLNSDYTQ